MSPAPVTHRYFPAFDVFRGIGILFVVLAHSPIQSRIIDALRPLGALGVHMFFALSGFLITYRLVEEHGQKGSISLRNFYRRRVRRILPPALIALVVLTLLGPVLHRLPTSFAEISACLLFYRNLYQPPMPDAWYTAHFWSLSLEEQFYLVWPMALVLLGPQRKRAAYVTLVWIALAALWRIRVQAADPQVNFYRTDLLADHLLWGCWIGLQWETIRQAVPPSVRTLGGIVGIAAAAALIYRQPPFWQPFFAMSVAVGFIFAAESVGFRVIRWRWAIWLGQASYDCYLWQSLFLPLPWIGMALPWTQRAPWSYLWIAAATSASFLLTFPRRRAKTTTDTVRPQELSSGIP